MDDIIITFDSGYRLDEGHRADLPPAFPLARDLKKQKGANIMSYFIPKSKGGYKNWLQNLHDEVETEGTKFSAPTADVTAVKAKTAAQLQRMNDVIAAESDLKSKRQAEKDGRLETNALVTDKVADWKRLPGWTAEIAQKLRVVSSSTDFDPNTFKPEFTVRILGGEIRIDWIKKGVDAVHVYSRLRGQTTWTFLAMDTSSPYIDGHPLAQAGVAEVREYMLRGVIADEEIGLDSDVLNVAWGG